MTHIYQKLKKYTGIYRCPDNITNFKIRVKIKEIPDISIATETELKEGWEVKEFKWQEKIFNNFEKQFYGDEKNCSTDFEKQYNSILKNSVNAPDTKLLFSYIHYDDFEYELEGSSIVKNKLRSENIDHSLEEVLDSGTEYNFRDSLQQAIESFENLCEKNSIMYIMADLGEYVQENWAKYEHVLCVMKYNEEKKILRVYPDFSNEVPYVLKINAETTKNYYYFIEHVSEDIPQELSWKESEIFRKLTEYKKSVKNLALNRHFELPPLNKLQVHVFFEIVSGKDFEYDDIYVKYCLDLPEKWTCKTPLLMEGLTQTCHTKNGGNGAYFGHLFDLILEYDIQDFFDVDFPKYPYIYFEIISRGSWDRYRCEGLTYLCLPMAKPGFYNFHLPCYRLSNGTTSELRRFFVGDCSNYNDITWVGLPRSVEGNVVNKYGVETIGTGTLSVRMNILHQSQAFMAKYNEAGSIKHKENFIFEKLNSSSLVKSVEQVVAAFRRARKNMIQARNM